jgi:hypothetical protein
MKTPPRGGVFICGAANSKTRVMLAKQFATVTAPPRYGIV